jgi:hypothetical protein
LFEQPRGMADTLVYNFAGFGDLRQKLLLCAGAGASLGMILSGLIRVERRR